MIQSDRLMMIASKIENGETMADIGTDHGFLPLYLFENGISPRVIMTDISRASLEKAMHNAVNSGCLDPKKINEQDIVFRTGDGLAVIDDGEVDAVVMAGIGGRLMCEILEADQEKSRSISKFILQPRRHPGFIRRYLLEKGYMITDESLVHEGKYICEIITAKPLSGILSDDRSEEGNLADVITKEMTDEMMRYPPESIVWEVPLWYANTIEECGGSGEASAFEYLERKLNREKLILKSRQSGKNADTDTTKSNIMYLENLYKSLIGRKTE